MAETEASAKKEEKRAIKPKRAAYRPDKVAIASETGQYIDACFGKTESFRIYRLVKEGDAYCYKLDELRSAPRLCRDKSHDLDVLESSAELLKDCQMVLAGKIGPAAVKALSDRGVMGLAAPLLLDDALKKLARN
jgi:predicted Fe-Mo cluster-binding NifX family protein